MSAGVFETHFQATRVSFADGLGVEALVVRQSDVDYAAFAGVHRAEGEGNAGRAHAVGGVSRHRAQLGLAHGAEVVNVADDALAVRKCARERLIDEVFERVEQLAAFAPEHRRVGAVDVDDAAALGLARARAKVETGVIEDVIQELLRLIEFFFHGYLTKPARACLRLEL